MKRATTAIVPSIDRPRTSRLTRALRTWHGEKNLGDAAMSQHQHTATIATTTMVSTIVVCVVAAGGPADRTRC
jgi:hypothetical protein